MNVKSNCSHTFFHFVNVIQIISANLLSAKCSCIGDSAPGVGLSEKVVLGGTKEARLLNSCDELVASQLVNTCIGKKLNNSTC